jgi:hypothetical protein
VGAHYAKRLLAQGHDVLATVRNLETEKSVFEKRLFGESIPSSRENTTGGRSTFQYDVGNANITLTELDLLKGGLEPLLSTAEGGIDHVVNAVNLGTIFSSRSLDGNLDEHDVFRLCHSYHRTLTEYATRTDSRILHVLVSTTGSGGIGLERMRISHNRDETGIPLSIILKARYAAEIRSHFGDFQRSSDGLVVHRAIVPASAIVDLTTYTGSVETYGDYRKLHGGRFIRAISPQVEINGGKVQDINENGFLQACYGLFGEDGPHTVADLQQLQLFMGVTTATKIAEIADNAVKGNGAFNYDVLNGGKDIPEQSEYAVHGFERRMQRRANGSYIPITLSPIAPFDISLRCFAYELLADVGLSTIQQVRECSTDEDTIRTLTQRMQGILQSQPQRLIASTSLGAAYDLVTSEGTYKTVGPFTRGAITNETIKECIEITGSFEQARRQSPKLDDFLASYETPTGDISTKDVIGYLAAFPVAQQMRKEGHF